MPLLRAIALAAATSCCAPGAYATDRLGTPGDPDARAARVEARMTDDVPATVGYWHGVPQLGVANPLQRRPGAKIGCEARARGFNILLGGGVKLAFDPRNGRNFEYLGEDSLLAGGMVGAAIRGVESAGVVSTINHFAINSQETLRMSADAVIDRDELREGESCSRSSSGSSRGGRVPPCVHTILLNGTKSCGNCWLLEDVLQRDRRFPSG